MQADIHALMRDAAALNLRVTRTRQFLRGGEQDVLDDVRALAVQRSQYVEDQLRPTALASLRYAEELFGEEPLPAIMKPDAAPEVSAAAEGEGVGESAQANQLEDVMYDRFVLDVTPTMASDRTLVDKMQDKIAALSQTFRDVIQQLSVSKVVDGVRESVAMRAVLFVAQSTSSPILKALLVAHALHSLHKERVWLKVAKAVARKFGTNLAPEDIESAGMYTAIADNLYRNALTIARAYIQDTPLSMAIDVLDTAVTKVAEMAVEAYLNSPDVVPLERQQQAGVKGGETSSFVTRLSEMVEQAPFSAPLWTAASVFFVNQIVTNVASVTLGSLLVHGVTQLGATLTGGMAATVVSSVVAFFAETLTLTNVLSTVAGLLFAAVKGVAAATVSIFTNTSVAQFILQALWLGVKTYGLLLIGACKTVLSVAMMNLMLTGGVVAAGGVVFIAYQAYVKLRALWWERPILAVQQKFGFNRRVIMSTQYGTWGEDLKFWMRDYLRLLITIPFTLTNKTVKWGVGLVVDYIIYPMLQRISDWFGASDFLASLQRKVKVTVDVAKFVLLLTVCIGGLSTVVSVSGAVAPVLASMMNMFSTFNLLGGDLSGARHVVVFSGGAAAIPETLWGLEWFASQVAVERQERTRHGAHRRHARLTLHGGAGFATLTRLR